MNKWAAVLMVCGACAAHAQDTVRYHLAYPEAGGHLVQVRMDLPSPRPAPLALIIPRGYPGGYALVLYDSFVEDVHAFTGEGKPVAVKRDLYGPRWKLGAAGENVARIEYSVDVVEMEKGILSAEASSKIRPQYVGLLGYSVFAYVDGMENAKAALQVDGPAGWPVLSTLAPAVPAPLNSVSVSAPNYYALADSEVLMGPAMQLKKYPGTIALVMAIYAEGEENVDQEGQFAQTALNSVQRYFGDTPFPAYTVQLELLKPLPGHTYGFSQEHLNSGTFVYSADRGITPDFSARHAESRVANYAHHMAHCWVPKRAYGVGYMPFTWEMPPIIDTIWFNEGFGRYASVAALADGMPAQEGADFRHRQLDGLRGVLKNAPDFIQRMSTVYLSREASFLYADDFRTGMNTFARGSLMAAEMDDRIREQTQGKESLRDALRALVAHIQKTQQPFTIPELAPLFKQATGVDVSDILERWLQPQEAVGGAPVGSSGATK